MLQQQTPQFPKINDQTLDTGISFHTAKEGLAFLLRRYARHQHKFVAAKIVLQLEMILKQHSENEFPQDRCSFYRLIRFWRIKSM